MCLYRVASLAWIVCVAFDVMIGEKFLFIDEVMLTYSAFLKEWQRLWLANPHVVTHQVFQQPRHVISASAKASDMG
jgi:hypothetical protein